jgi:hypothetical protein
MRIRATTPYIVRRLETQEGNWEIGLDVWNRTCIFQNPNHNSIFGAFVSDIARVANTGIITTYDYRVLQTDRDTRKGTFHIDRTISCPFFSRRDHNLRQTVRLCMSLQRSFTICMEDINRLNNLLVDILNKLFNWLGKHRSIARCVGTLVGRETLYPLSTLSLLELAVKVSAELSIQKNGQRRGNIPVPSMLEVIE